MTVMKDILASVKLKKSFAGNDVEEEEVLEVVEVSRESDRKTPHYNELKCLTASPTFDFKPS